MERGIRTPNVTTKGTDLQSAATPPSLPSPQILYDEAINRKVTANKARPDNPSPHHILNIGDLDDQINCILLLNIKRVASKHSRREFYLATNLIFIKIYLKRFQLFWVQTD